MNQEDFDPLFDIAKKNHEILQDPWEIFELINEMQRNGVHSVLELGSHKGGTALLFLGSRNAYNLCGYVYYS